MKTNINQKILVIGLVFLFLGASAILSVGASFTTEQSRRVIQQTIQAINKNIIGQTCLTGNVKISSNAGNDYHPRMTTNAHDQIIVVYEQEINLFSKQVPVVYSANKGQTWKIAYLFDSINFTSGSGVLQYPDIVYNPQNDLLFLAMVDPNAEIYNNEMAFIPGDIASGGDSSWSGISFTGCESYTYASTTCTNNFFLPLTTQDGYDQTQAFGLGFYTYPEFEHPTGMNGISYDGNSLFQSAPNAEIEMGSNANRIFIVAETDLGRRTNITIKSTVNDEALLTNGEQQNGMDKYADVEQWPGEYLGDGTDPYVSGSENKVCVVYVQDGAIKCSYSTCAAGTYEPGFSWQVSTVESGASAPAIYMQGSNVYCAYVKNGNLYLKISEDSGATWGTAEKMNDVDGKVVATPGSLDIGKGGIVFADTRDGTSQIYFAPITPSEPEIPTITGPAEGDANTAYDYTIMTIDGQGDQVSYFIDWGDGTNSGWVGPYASGAQATQSHTWSAEGNYTIKAKAKDTGGHESGWAQLTVTMPIEIITPFQLLLERLFERFPNAFPILRYLLE